MNRRTFLVGAAGTAIGSSALIGTGAFTTAEATRTATVKVSNDDTDALLGFSNRVGYGGTENGRSPYANVRGGVLEIDFTNSGSGPEAGMNKAGAKFTFDNTFKVINQGVSTVLVGFDVSGLEALDELSEVSVMGNGVDLTETLDFSTTPVSIAALDNDAVLSPGEELYISWAFETSGDRGGPFDVDVTVGAVDIDAA